MLNRAPGRLALAVALLLTGCGTRKGAEDAAGQRAAGRPRVIEVGMVDTAFQPAELTVSSGETVTFRFTNTGKAVHEAFIGDVQDQEAHEADMAMGMGHGIHGDDAKRTLTLEPGESGQLTYTFAERATLEVGCHRPGHYKAGMRASVTVA